MLDGLLYHTGVRRYPNATRLRRGEAEGLPADPGAERGGRADLRDLLAFTIDPDDARDFDDAISVGREGDGMRAWVHIADVSAVVPAESALDRDAAARALSVYVPGRVEPMLPLEPSAGLCSLVPERDRSCLTVEIPFGATPRGGRTALLPERHQEQTAPDLLAGGSDSRRPRGL